MNIEGFNRGTDLDDFIQGVGDYELNKVNEQITDVIVNLSHLRGFIRGNNDMKAVYTFLDGRLDHISIVI